jgi:hypothetical protein
MDWQPLTIGRPYLEPDRPSTPPVDRDDPDTSRSHTRSADPVVPFVVKGSPARAVAEQRFVAEAVARGPGCRE